MSMEFRDIIIYNYVNLNLEGQAMLNASTAELSPMAENEKEREEDDPLCDGNVVHKILVL